MNMMESVQVCFKKYADFDNRASREEYWWFFLFCFIAGFVIAAYSAADGNSSLDLLFQAVVFLPSLAVGVRRLHDTNRSGWNYLWAFTIIGIIAVIIWFCEEGNKTKNRFGAKPIH
jgi:uncharacterized membrane protein YhaH (DUF805 family)